MTILTVTSEGGVTLDRELLETLDIAPGDRLVVLPRAEGGLSLSPVPEGAADGVRRTGGLEAFFGSLKNEHDIHFTLDELKEEIEEAWARQR